MNKGDSCPPWDQPYRRTLAMNLAELMQTRFDPYEAIAVLKPLATYVVGMVIYSVFIFKFYRFISRRDIFEFDLNKYEQVRYRAVRALLHAVSYVCKYLIVFPFIAFFWFAVLGVLLFFLSKNQTLANVLLLSMAVVSAIRVTAYYNQDLSGDLAKILPFALLGVFVINISYLGVSDPLNALQEVRAQPLTIVYYLVFVIALEFTLRICYGFLVAVLTPPKRRNQQPQAVQAFTGDLHLISAGETPHSGKAEVQPDIPQPARVPAHYAGSLPIDRGDRIDPAPTGVAPLSH